jgi:hypothetical protein
MKRTSLILVFLFYCLSIYAQSDDPSTSLSESHISLIRDGKEFFIAPGASGEFLSTNGTTLSWSSISSADIAYTSNGQADIEGALDSLYNLSTPETLRGSAALDFPNTTAGTSSDLTITVTGAALGDVASLGASNAAVSANTSYSAWVSAADTVTVRFNNYSSGAVNPAGGTFRVMVFKY